MKRLISTLLLTCALLFVLLAGITVSQAEPPDPLRTLNSGHHFLPPYPNPRDRFGFDSVSGDPLTNYDVAQLDAGWYSDWGTSLNPAHPGSLTYVQLVRFKANSGARCSNLHTDPAQVTVSPSKAVIAQIAAEHPGSLWMMSNEPDSCYQGNPVLPNVYAHVYHEFYYYIKGLDPTALIANGGIVQPTPCRMAYLDIVWDTYQQAYGETMPVDVWNIHAFILREVHDSWGASTPPGVPTSCGIDYPLRDGDDIDVLRDNLIAFRQWMKDKGEQDKPLIISEYGVLWPEYYPNTQTPFPDEDGLTFSPARVSHFMTQTFDLFLDETFPAVGYPQDDYRLVQAWAWYSLSEDQQYNGYLFCNQGLWPPTCQQAGSGQISPMGQTFADYVAALADTPYADLTLHSNATLDTSPLQNIALGDPYESTSVTLPVWVYAANLGNLTATNVPLLADTPYALANTLTLPPRYTTNVTPFTASIVLTQPARYDFDPYLDVTLDPDDVTGDPRLWNNVATVAMPDVIDARPDLALVAPTWNVRTSGTVSALLHITLTVTNEGVWPAPPVSATLSLSDTHSGLLISQQQVPVPALEFGDQAIITDELTLPGPALYYLALEVDGDGVVNEPDEEDNRVDLMVDARPDLLIPTVDWGTQSPAVPSSTLNVTFTVSNAGSWSAHAVSGTRHLSNTYGSMLLAPHHFPIPNIDPGGQVSIVQEMILPALDDDFYHLLLDADSDGILDEQNEDNNQADVMIPRVITITLEPGSAGVLTSASGHVTLQFVTGTVTTSLELCFVPLWPPELPPGPPRHIEAFRLTICQGQQVVSPTLLLPVTVTWQYASEDVAGMDEDELGLYYWAEGERWQRVSCLAEQRWVDENRLSTCIQQLGEYVFGYTYKQNLPLILLDNEESSSVMHSTVQPETQKTQRADRDVFPGSPLRLPPLPVPTERR